uniref:putative B3 domain-containing protein At5g66980 n=1 Tax=Erigeron canadensis TaxID=72917 RepID=UPI001CB9CA3A|nr:putative B3 domain-containing protein At5g66980 [Erigeron canadensis]
MKRERDSPEKIPIIINKDPEFFEVFLPDRISHQLRVPPDFVKNFDGKIPEAVIVKDLSGRVWHVDIKQEKNGVFFKNGWNKIVNEKGLEFGQFLVFRYTRVSKSFTVRIFGKDACKVEEQDYTKPFIRVKDEFESDPVDLKPVPKVRRNSRKAC